MNKLLIGGIAIALLLMSTKKTDPAAPGEDPVTDPVQDQNLSLVDQWINVITSNPEWMVEIQRKATATGQTLEQQLLHDANWVIQQGWQLP